MRVTSFVACGFVVVLAGTAHAQTTKFSGKCVAQKADPAYTAEVGDRAAHVLMLAKQKCTWDKAEIAGLELKDEEDTVTSDITGNSSRDHGYGVGTTSSGEKYFVRFDGTSMLKNNVPTSLKCTWSFTGGTGKLKGLTGKGTCAGTMNPDGTGPVNVEGEYQIVAKSGTH